MVSVQNIRTLGPGWRNDPRYVYIGRAGHGLPGPFGNPFRLQNTHDRLERGLVLARYEEWFRAKVASDDDFSLMLAQIPFNAVLVCFCAPQACHGDVIADYLNHG